MEEERGRIRERRIDRVRRHIEEQRAFIHTCQTTPGSSYFGENGIECQLADMNELRKLERELYELERR